MEDEPKADAYQLITVTIDPATQHIASGPAAGYASRTGLAEGTPCYFTVDEHGDALAVAASTSDHRARPFTSAGWREFVANAEHDKIVKAREAANA